MDFYNAEPSGDYRRPSLHDEVNAREAAASSVPQTGFKGRFYQNRKERLRRRGRSGLTKAEECQLALRAIRERWLGYEERWATELTLDDLVKLAQDGRLTAKEEVILNAILTLRSESTRGHAAARLAIIAAESHNLQEDMAEFKAETREPPKETNVNILFGMLPADERRARLDSILARIGGRGVPDAPAARTPAGSESADS